VDARELFGEELAMNSAYGLKLCCLLGFRSTSATEDGERDVDENARDIVS
jgi:hypothetical protein